jgi:hypothetical protein
MDATQIEGGVAEQLPSIPMRVLPSMGSMTTAAHTIDERTTTLTLAARAQCDPRTALRALREGPDAIGVLMVRERVRRAMRELGIPVIEAR